MWAAAWATVRHSAAVTTARRFAAVRPRVTVPPLPSTPPPPAQGSAVEPDQAAKRLRNRLTTVFLVCGGLVGAAMYVNAKYGREAANATATTTDAPAAPCAAAVCRLQGTDSAGRSVTGLVRFRQDGQFTIVDGSIRGLRPGVYGVHVLETGDLSEGVTSAGAHFNPYRQPHGLPSDTLRHAGDLGNVQVQADGVGHLHDRNRLIALAGPESVVGRALVIDAVADDGKQETRPQALALGIIGMAKATEA